MVAVPKMAIARALKLTTNKPNHGGAEQDRTGPLENMRILGELRYIVWTQAGFKKAVRTLHLVNDDNDPVENYPKQYPCVIDFAACYRGYHYWYARCIPLDKAIENARNNLQMLINADKEHRANVQHTGITIWTKKSQ